RRPGGYQELPGSVARPEDGQGGGRRMGHVPDQGTAGLDGQEQEVGAAFSFSPFTGRRWHAMHVAQKCVAVLGQRHAQKMPDERRRQPLQALALPLICLPASSPCRTGRRKTVATPAPPFTVSTV